MKRGGDIRQDENSLDWARYSAAQKDEVHALLEAILDRLDTQQRGPDRWEETCLVRALHFLESGLYARAQKELDDCILPMSGRPIWQEEQANKNPQRYTMARLRTRFGGVKAVNK